jgi:hypothetical protein
MDFFVKNVNIWGICLKLKRIHCTTFVPFYNSQIISKHQVKKNSQWDSNLVENWRIQWFILNSSLLRERQFAAHYN